MSLIDELIRQGWLNTPRIIEAFRAVKRADFMPVAPPGGEPRPLYGREDMHSLAELNEALPIGHGQTISQPLTVAFMMELLQPEPGQKILDVGAGSGWTTALLAYIVSQKGNSKSETLPPKADPPKAENSKQVQNSKLKTQNGKVIAIELIPELKEFGEKNVAKYNFIEKGIVEFLRADGSKGYEKEAPYDRVLASASGRELPKAWKEQLKIGGRIVAPVGTSIWLFVKNGPSSAKATAGEGEFTETEHPGFAFVPLK